MLLPLLGSSVLSQLNMQTKHDGCMNVIDAYSPKMKYTLWPWSYGTHEQYPLIVFAIKYHVACLPLFQKFDKCFEDSHAANKDETLCMPLVSIIKNLTHLSDGLVVLLSLVRQFDAFRSCLAKRQLANSFMKDLGGGGRA